MATPRWEPTPDTARPGLVPSPSTRPDEEFPPEPETVEMEGLLGTGPTAGVWRLYPSHKRDEYYEIPDDDIVTAIAVDDDLRRITVRAGATVRYVSLYSPAAESAFLRPTDDPEFETALAGTDMSLVVSPYAVTGCRRPCRSW